MNKLQTRRLYFVIICLLSLSIAAALILYALKQNLNVFYTPAQLASASLPSDASIRLGGLVKTGSIKRDQSGLGVTFTVTDFKKDLLVYYIGVLPDLFREGKGVVVEGKLNRSGLLLAQQVLAKHDENYMPKNVYRALRENRT